MILSFFKEKLYAIIIDIEVRSLLLRREIKFIFYEKNIKIKRLSKKLDHVKIKLYKIKLKRGESNYKIALPRYMKIYPIFYISLLELVLARAPRALNLEVQEEPNRE